MKTTVVKRGDIPVAYHYFGTCSGCGQVEELRFSSFTDEHTPEPELDLQQMGVREAKMFVDRPVPRNLIPSVLVRSCHCCQTSAEYRLVRIERKEDQ